MTTPPRVTLIAAVAENGVIGADGDIPWRIPADFAHFKALTLGHVLVMGRATHESIGRPLPGRTTIVLTRDPGYRSDGVSVAGSLTDALRQASALGAEEVYVAGGASVYAEALGLADAQVLTEVHAAPTGDTRYPDFDRREWVEVRREPHLDAEIPYEFVWWQRRPARTG